VAAEPAPRVPVAYIRRAHGVAGAVVVRTLDGTDPGRFVPGARFGVRDDHPRALTVATAAHHPDGLLVSFDEIADRDAADSLRGATLTIDRAERRALLEGEFWEEDLVGRAAVDPSGSELGTVTAVVFAAAQDRIVVETADGAGVEVPFVTAIVVSVPEGGEPIVIDPPDGLFP
jgi:16S rRNA processing protein RimM